MAIVTEAEVWEELGLCPPTAQEVQATKTAIIKAQGAVKRMLRYDPELKTRTEYYPQRDYTGRNLSAWDEVEGGDQPYSYRQQTSELILQHIPVRMVWFLWIDEAGKSDSVAGAFADATLKVQGTDYWPNWDLRSTADQICHDGIIRSETAWPAFPGSVKVSYYAGYSPSELAGTSTFIDASPIWEATLNEAARRAKRTIMMQKKTGVGFVAGNFASESLGDYSYSLGATARSDEALYGYLNDVLPSTREMLSEYINWGYPLAS